MGCSSCHAWLQTDPALLCLGNHQCSHRASYDHELISSNTIRFLFLIYSGSIFHPYVKILFRLHLTSELVHACLIYSPQHPWNPLCASQLRSQGLSHLLSCTIARALDLLSDTFAELLHMNSPAAPAVVSEKKYPSKKSLTFFTALRGFNI